MRHESAGGETQPGNAGEQVMVPPQPSLHLALPSRNKGGSPRRHRPLLPTITGCARCIVEGHEESRKGISERLYISLPDTWIGSMQDDLPCNFAAGHRTK